MRIRSLLSKENNMSLKNICLLALVTFIFTNNIHAGEQKFPVSAIPDSLLKNAHAVMRLYDARYVINGPAEYTVSERYVVTVLDEKGTGFGNCTEYYSKGNSIDDLNGFLYNKEGEEVKKIKRRDIVDVAAYGSNFVTDYRALLHTFGAHQYPYTTEYEVEKTYYSTLSLASWTAVPGLHCSVQQATVSVEYPLDYPLRFRSKSLPVQPVVATRDGQHILTASLMGFKALKDFDEISVDADMHMPGIVLACDTFSLFGTNGSMATWKDFGRFFYQLNDGRDVLTPQMKATVHQLTDTCTSNQQKINVLYQYLQKNTRYVSIQLGIGGWQTFDATFVCEKKYGDCKALSNFMKAMLKEAGIVSYTTLARVGSPDLLPMNPEFPYNIFNHAILCVPTPTDTTWLECTSASTPAGYLSNSTSDRKVLVGTPEGGVVVSTPTYGPETNVLIRKAELVLNDKNELSGKVSLNYGGLFWEREHANVIDAPRAALDKHLSTVLGFSDYSIAEATARTATEGKIPFIKETMNITATAEANTSGSSLMLNTRMFPLLPVPSSRADTSTSKFQLHKSYCMKDTVIITLNGNYAPSTPFKDVDITYPFGSYHLSYTINGKTLTKTSVYTIKAGIYSGDQFANLKKMRGESIGTSRNMVVLGKL